MNLDTSERSFEEAIEAGLVSGPPRADIGHEPGLEESAAPWGDTSPGGYPSVRPKTTTAPCA